MIERKDLSTLNKQELYDLGLVVKAEIDKLENAKNDLPALKSYQLDIIRAYNGDLAPTATGASAAQRVRLPAVPADELYAWLSAQPGEVKTPDMRKAFQGKSIEGAMKVLRFGDPSKGVLPRAKVRDAGKGAQGGSFWTAIKPAEKTGQGGKGEPKGKAS